MTARRSTTVAARRCAASIAAVVASCRATTTDGRLDRRDASAPTGTHRGDRSDRHRRPATPSRSSPTTRSRRRHALNDALAEFTADTGIGVEILVAGDTGTMLSKASLTAGNPEGDVMWGVDNTFLSRAVADGVFEPYESPGAGSIPAELTELAPNGEATPVDYGDVCVNYDVAWFADNGLDVPDLARRPRSTPPTPTCSSCRTRPRRRRGWRSCWRPIDEYGVEPDDSGSRLAGVLAGARRQRRRGRRRLDAGVLRAFLRGRRRPQAARGQLRVEPARRGHLRRPARRGGRSSRRCFRQVEFAGVLRGTDFPDEARSSSTSWSANGSSPSSPLNLFVYPANADVELPPEFVEAAVIPDRSAHARPGRHRRQPQHVDRRVDGAGDRVNRLPRWLPITLAAAPAVPADRLLRVAVRHAARHGGRPRRGRRHAVGVARRGGVVVVHALAGRRVDAR